MKLAETAAAYSIGWLSNHILILDKKYTVFFEEHGVV
jgi:hemerythrin